jgi:hypothetical protein
VNAPQWLKDVAEEVWTACEAIADSPHESDKTVGAIAAARASYAELYRDAQNLTHDATVAEVARGRAQAARQARDATARPSDSGAVERLRGRASSMFKRFDRNR